MARMTKRDQNKLLTPGNLVAHFKRYMTYNDIKWPKELMYDPEAYLYKIIGVATHSETKEQMVVYQALYGGKAMYCRPLAMFISPVDQEKYPTTRNYWRMDNWPDCLFTKEDCE